MFCCEGDVVMSKHGEPRNDLINLGYVLWFEMTHRQIQAGGIIPQYHASPALLVSRKAPCNLASIHVYVGLIRGIG